VGLAGTDSLDFLQRISTNDVLNLETGEGRESILVNEKGRVVDQIRLMRETPLLVLLGVKTRGSDILVKWISKFIIAEDIQISDESSNFIQYLILDIEDKDISSLQSKPTWHSLKLNIGPNNGYWIVARRSEKRELDNQLTRIGLAMGSSEEYQQLRIEHSIPDWPNEISDAYNPFELEQEHAISFTKGCYVGQEVIARLDTYKKVQRRLAGFRLEAFPSDLPAEILHEEKRVGTLTSCGPKMDSNRHYAGLGFLDTSFNVSSNKICYLRSSMKSKVFII
jgi:folate-binding protein YgfZ